MSLKMAPPTSLLAAKPLAASTMIRKTKREVKKVACITVFPDLVQHSIKECTKTATMLHRKKAFRYYRHQPGCHVQNSSWAGIIYKWRHNSRPGRVWFVDGNIEKLFLRCREIGHWLIGYLENPMGFSSQPRRLKNRRTRASFPYITKT